MQKTTFFLILIAALGIGSALYVLGGTPTTVSADPVVLSYPRQVGTPFQQHVEEGMGNSATLESYFKELDEIRRRDQRLTEAVSSYQAHVDGYFQEAGSEASSIQDSSLKALAQGKLALEKDSIAAKMAVLLRTQGEMHALASRAEDLGKLMKILSSLGPLKNWAKENHPAITDMRLLSTDYRKLLDDFKAGESAI